jgi:hypothetical protein
MDDKGKGLVNMIIVYFIGRYLKKYPVKINTKKLWLALAVLIAFCCIANSLITAVRGLTSWPFARECTITILAIAVVLFLIALNTTFYSKPINIVASKTLYIFLLDFYITLKHFIPIDNLSNSKFYILACIGYSLLVLIVSFVIAEILQYPAKLIEKILEIIEKLAIKIFNKFKPFFNKLLLKIKTSTNNEENANV